MKHGIISRGIFLTLIAVFFSSVLWAQEDKSKRLSPPATATGTIDGATITINYSSPGVKGRKIWGGLVPYDKVWRAGANEATLFTTTKDIMVEGKKLPAGKYSLYAIPGEKEWVFIFNSETGQWGIKRDGSTTEDPAKDVLRVTVKPHDIPNKVERMKFVISKHDFALVWDKLEVPVRVR